MSEFNGLVVADRELVYLALRNYRKALDEADVAFHEAEESYYQDHQNKRDWPFFWRKATKEKILGKLGVFPLQRWKHLRNKGYLSEEHYVVKKFWLYDGDIEGYLSDMYDSGTSFYITPEQAKFVNKWGNL